ncbi:MAG TPA: c-type cytochrome, partial [Myxococcales bacterium]|nr:c-type cytochrome [Myxococcales bacterium]
MRGRVTSMKHLILLTISLFLCAATAHAEDRGAAVEGDVDNGQTSYLKRCSQCHGVDGKADGPAAEFMFPRPRVFANNNSYKVRTTNNESLPTDWDLFDIISKGLPGSSMPGFAGLPEQERWDLVAFVKSLSEDFEDEDEERIVEEALFIPSPEVTDALLARGKELFVNSKCASCHGENGLGNAKEWDKQKDTWGNPILAKNLHDKESFRGGHQPYDLYRLLTTGYKGTPMPVFPFEDDNDRWALAHYVLTISAPVKAQRDETIRAIMVNKIPTDGSSEGWNAAPVARFKTMSNVVEPPRLFWSSVEYVNVQAVYSKHEVALRIQWDDRSNSKGTDLDTEYKDLDTTIYAGTKHPDQFAVQFPARNQNPSVRPYFMMGDSKRAVNMWRWAAHTDKFVETNAKGFATQKNQPESSQSIMGKVTFDDGRYTMVVRRTLVTDDPKKDIQFKSGDFVPVMFHVWDGERGNLGQRRSFTTWSWLQLTPPIPNYVQYVPYGTFGVSFILLL